MAERIAAMRRVTITVAILLLLGCAGAHNLKPGIPRGMLEEGFDKTTEGISLTVRNRDPLEVWDATVRGVVTILRGDRQTRLVDQTPHRLIRLERKDFLGTFPQSYTGIFLKAEKDAVVVEVSKINWGRMQVTEWGPTEGDYLRAIQRELRQP
jgi:hypothetical protein